MQIKDIKNKTIVVMGGSFNPPTIAHYRLMKEALDAINADVGYFVPVSDAYLKRKMKNCHPPVILPPEMRVSMLESMCAGDSRMEVSRIEIGTIEARTMVTLDTLQEENPEADIYFIMGADKLKLLVHLTESRGFLEQYSVVLFSREDESLQEEIQTNEILSKYEDRILLLTQPVGTSAVSSSVVRKRMLEGEYTQDLLCPGVWEMFKEVRGTHFPDRIIKFAGEYDFLSNSFGCMFVWQGLSYSNVEAAYQSSKYQNAKDRTRLCNCSASKAASIGKDITPYPGWEGERLEIMKSILLEKFGQNPDLMCRLKKTAGLELVNGNSKKNTFWGMDLYSWQGENNLGKILMKIRDERIKKMRYTVEIIKDIAINNPDRPIIYFWGHTPNPKTIKASCLSQWYDCRFSVDGVLYHTTEQYMMASKALLFGDDETYHKIMSADNPRDYKKLGREIRGFDQKTWDANKYDIVVKGNKSKFYQNQELKEYLLSTGDAILAEASPYDKIWGIGLDREHAEKGSPEQWQGENLLGCALMETRDWLQE